MPTIRGYHVVARAFSEVAFPAAAVLVLAGLLSLVGLAYVAAAVMLAGLVWFARIVWRTYVGTFVSIDERALRLSVDGVVVDVVPRGEIEGVEVAAYDSFVECLAWGGGGYEEFWAVTVRTAERSVVLPPLASAPNNRPTAEKYAAVVARALGLRSDE